MHDRMIKFAMFQQNYMIVIKMAKIHAVNVLLVLRVFASSFIYTFVSVMKQYNINENSLQFVCIKTNVNLQSIEIWLSWATFYILLLLKTNIS